MDYRMEKRWKWTGCVNFFYLHSFFLLLLLNACSVSLRDIRSEVDAEITKLVLDLQSVENKEDLQKRSTYIKKRFTRIADLLIDTRNCEQVSAQPSVVAEALFVELARLYEMPGVRDLLETLQEEAVHKLDKKSRNSSLCRDCSL